MSAHTVKRYRRVFGAIFGLCTGFCLSAHASIFGEENVTLGAILSENTAQTLNLGQTLTRLKELTALARDTAAFSRESVQAGKNIHAILTHPGEFARYSTRAWSTAFPEIGDIAADVEDARMSADAIAHVGAMNPYDPYVYVHFIDRMRFLQGSSFEVLAHGADPWGINTRYDAVLDALSQEHGIAQDVLATAVQTVNGLGISPVQAAVSTAQSSAVSATAQVQAAATLQRIARTQEWVVMQQVQSSQQSAGILQREMDAALRSRQSWSLDPLGTRSAYARPRH